MGLSENLSISMSKGLWSSFRWNCHLPFTDTPKYHSVAYTFIYMYAIYIYIMDVDQNKGIWGSYNRRSTANQPRSQRCQSREGSVVSDTILRREPSKHCYISQYLERNMAWARAYSGGFNNRGAIADQPRTNRGFHRHCLKIELLWIVRLWTLLTVSRQTQIQYIKDYKKDEM